MAAVVPVEAIPEERLAGMHRSRHLVRFHMKVTPLELHLRFVHRVKFRVKYMQKPFVYDLNIYLETPRVIENIKNKPPVVHRVNFTVNNIVTY